MKFNKILLPILTMSSLAPMVTMVSCKNENNNPFANVQQLRNVEDTTLDNVSNIYFKDIQNNPNVFKCDILSYIAIVLERKLPSDRSLWKSVNYNYEFNKIDAINRRFSFTISQDIEQFDNTKIKSQWIINDLPFKLIEADNGYGSVKFFLVPDIQYTDRQWNVTYSCERYYASGAYNKDTSFYNWEIMPSEWVSVREELINFLYVESWYLEYLSPTVSTVLVDWGLNEISQAGDYGVLPGGAYSGSHSYSIVKAGTKLKDLKYAILPPDYTGEVLPFDMNIFVSSQCKDKYKLNSTFTLTTASGSSEIDENYQFVVQEDWSNPIKITATFI